MVKTWTDIVHNSAEKNEETGLETHCDTCLSMRPRLRLAKRLQERLPSIVADQKVTTAGWNRGRGGLHRPRALEWKQKHETKILGLFPRPFMVWRSEPHTLWRETPPPDTLEEDSPPTDTCRCTDTCMCAILTRRQRGSRERVVSAAASRGLAPPHSGTGRAAAHAGRPAEAIYCESWD